jgi:hypothetical protein
MAMHVYNKSYFKGGKRRIKASPGKKLVYQKQARHGDTCLGSQIIRRWR